MRRPLVAAAAGVAALGLSIPIALLGRAVLAAPGRAEAAAVDWPAAAHVRESRSLFERAADGLLGADRPDEFFGLVHAYRQAVSAPIGTSDSANPVRLAALARQVGPDSERSQAHLMVGVVFALPAGGGSISFDRMRAMRGGGALLEQAAAEVREAAVIDERNEAAKYDLELLLKSQDRSLRARTSGRGTQQLQPSSHNKRAGNDVRRPRTRRRIRGGGVYGSGSGY